MQKNKKKPHPAAFSGLLLLWNSPRFLCHWHWTWRSHFTDGFSLPNNFSESSSVSRCILLCECIFIAPFTGKSNCRKKNCQRSSTTAWIHCRPVWWQPPCGPAWSNWLSGKVIFIMAPIAQWVTPQLLVAFFASMRSTNKSIAFCVKVILVHRPINEHKNHQAASNGQPSPPI